jgi:hypothetical protein
VRAQQRKKLCIYIGRATIDVDLDIVVMLVHFLRT